MEPFSSQEISESVVMECIYSEKEQGPANVGYYEIGRLQRKESCGYSYECRKYRSVKPQQLGKVAIIKNILFKPEPSLNQLIYHNEIKVLSHLRHSKISINYLTHWKNNQKFYIVMERNQFGNLAEFKDYLDSANLPLKNSQILYFLKQILQALKILHEHKVLHRNLTVSSIAFDDELGIKLTDFSLAKIGQDQTFQGINRCGTLNYLPPQLLKKDRHETEWSQKTQVWSLGVIIYYLIYGQFPLDLQKLSFQIKFDSKALKNKQLIELLSKMLEIQPTKRATIKQLLQSKTFTFLQDQLEIKSQILKNYEGYFDERRKQKSTWKRNIDNCKLQVTPQIMAILQRHEKIVALKVIHYQKFGYFILLSNLKLIAHYNNGLIMAYQERLRYRVNLNEQKILLWVYKQHFAKLIEQKKRQQSSIIYQQTDCNLRKLIIVKGSVLIRLTNQVIQVFFVKNDQIKKQFKSFKTTVCINYNKQHPNMIKVIKDKDQICHFQTLQQGKQNKYCQYVRNVFEAIVSNSLVEVR